MEKTVAKTLLEVRSISYGLDEEIYSNSGVRLPIHCDNRKILAHPNLCKTIGKWLGDLIKKHYPDVEKLVGTAVAGISFAVLASEYLGISMTYVWEPLDQNNHKFDHICKPNTKVVIVDDVINTGSTLLKVAEFLKEYDCEILGAVSVFSYEFEDTNKKLKKANISHYSLTNFDILTLISMQTGKITYPEYQQILKFKVDPHSDSWLK